MSTRIPTSMLTSHDAAMLARMAGGEQLHIDDLDAVGLTICGRLVRLGAAQIDVASSRYRITAAGTQLAADVAVMPAPPAAPAPAARPAREAVKDDLVAVLITQQREGGTQTSVVVIQRRSVATKIVEEITDLVGAQRRIFRDVVSNPVLVDLSAVLSAQLVAVTPGPKLVDSLGPIPSDIILLDVVPEVGWGRRAEPDSGERRATAADEDAIERAMRDSRFGGSRN